MNALISADCERARAHASLALDCELSELERAGLRAHLAGCADCAAFVADLREVTHELRAARLPEPSRPLVPRRPDGRLPMLLAALAVTCAAGAGGLAGALRPAAPAASAFATAAPLLVVNLHVPGSRLPVRAAL